MKSSSTVSKRNKIVTTQANGRKLLRVEAAHWQRKRRVAEEMKAEFEAEGNAWLQQRRLGEAEGNRRYVDTGCATRYLYGMEKPT